MMSVWTWSARWNRVAIPCGLDPSGALSATVGMPAEAENRTVTGVEGREACGALVSFGRVGRGGERPGEHHALGMDGPEAGMHSPGKLIEQTERSLPAISEAMKRISVGRVRSEAIPVYRIALTASSVVSTALAMKL